MKKSLLTEAIRLAREKLPLHPELNCFPHFSFVVQKGRILDWATNNDREPPRHYGYHRGEDASFRPKFHAEAAAYRKARGIFEGEAFELVNVRLNRAGEVKLSRPCDACYGLMTALGCVGFYYSSGNGFLRLVA